MKTKKLLASVVKEASGSDEERVLTVIACDPSIDRDFERFDTKSLLVPVKGNQMVAADKLTSGTEIELPAFIDHGRSVNDQIGSVVGAKLIEDDKLELKIKLLDDDVNADKVYKLATGGHLGNSVSVGYGFTEDTDLVEDKYINCELLEVSIVWKGSNRNAQVTSVKQLKEEGNMEKSAKEVAESLRTIGDAAKTIVAAASVAADSLEADEADEDQTAEQNTDVQDQETATQEKNADKAKEKEADESDTTKEKSFKDEKGESMKIKSGTETIQKEDVSKKADMGRSDFKRYAMKAFIATREKNFAAANEFKNKAAERLGYADGKSAEILMSEEVDRDVMKRVENIGGILAKVDKKRISGPTYRKIIRETIARFQPVPYGSKKPTGKPTFGKFRAEPMPWALIYTWDEELAEDTIFNLYDEMVQELAEGYVKTAEYIIFSFDGKDDAGAELADYRATGLEVITGIPEQSGVYDKTAIAAFTSAVSKAKNAGGNITLAMNTVTLGKLGSIQKNENGDLLFDNSNNKISLGLLGAVDIEVNDNVSDDTVVVGNFKKYGLIERKELQIKYSDQATVGDQSLFETDGEAVRGRVRLDGQPYMLDAFCIVKFS